MNKLQSLLVQLRLFDSDKTLSLTSILLMVAIYRLAVFPADGYSLSILTLALAHANIKKFAAHKKKIQEDNQTNLSNSSDDKLKDLEEQLKAVVKQVTMGRL